MSPGSLKDQVSGVAERFGPIVAIVLAAVGVRVVPSLEFVLIVVAHGAECLEVVSRLMEVVENRDTSFGNSGKV